MLLRPHNSVFFGYCCICTLAWLLPWEREHFQTGLSFLPGIVVCCCMPRGVFFSPQLLLWKAFTYYAYKLWYWGSLPVKFHGKEWEIYLKGPLFDNGTVLTVFDRQFKIMQPPGSPPTSEMGCNLGWWQLLRPLYWRVTGIKKKSSPNSLGLYQKSGLNVLTCSHFI